MTEAERLKKHEGLIRKLAWRIWMKIRGNSLYEFDDLLQVARMSAWEALQRFDPALGFRESTFIGTTVAGRLMIEMRDNNHVIKSGSRDVKLLANRIGKLATEDVDELVASTGAKKKQVLRAIQYMRANGAVACLDAPLLDSEDSLHDIVGFADTAFEEAELVDEVIGVCKTDWERQIIRLRLRGLTQGEVAKVLSTGQNSISRALMRIKGRLG